MTHAKIVQISLALILAVPLMGALPGCTKTEENHFLYVLTGKVPDETGALVYPSSSEPVAALLVEPSSSEEVVSVAAVVEPEPSSVEPEVVPEPVCEEWIWRGNVYDCHGQILRPVE